MKWTSDEIVRATGAAVVRSARSAMVGVGTDTRSDLRERLFVALKGDSFDAHDFLPQAAAAGAEAILIHRDPPANLPEHIGIYRVKDTLQALAAMGTFARRQSKAKFLALTGSNGKTTTKEFAAALIGAFRPTHASHGSFNNHWGVPLTLLEVRPEHEVAIIEMGMNHAGELTDLVRIAEPDVVMCTTVGRAHVEHFGSVEKIAAAKEEIYVAARPDAVRIFSLDNEWTVAMRQRSRERAPSAREFCFSSTNSTADVRLGIVELHPKRMVIEGAILGKSGRVSVDVFGAQNLTNLMAASCLGLAAGLSADQVWAGLEKCKTGWGRNQFVNLRSGAEMIFDAYNANPDSMGALIENTARLKVGGKKWGVLGQMLELGGASEELHRDLGQAAAKVGFEGLLFFGADFKNFAAGLRAGGFKGALSGGESFSEDDARNFAANLKQGDLVVVKGSRGNKLERVVPFCDPLDFSPKK